MQLQSGYVNDYVVIIFCHYIKPRGTGRSPENVTWASFFVPFGRAEKHRQRWGATVFLLKARYKLRQQPLADRLDFYL